MYCSNKADMVTVLVSVSNCFLQVGTYAIAGFGDVLRGNSGSHGVWCINTAGGGTTTVRISGMPGRLSFQKVIDDVTRPTTFSIRADSVPHSSFVAKVRGENGDIIQKSMPS